MALVDLDTSVLLQLFLHQDRLRVVSVVRPIHHFNLAAGVVSALKGRNTAGELFAHHFGQLLVLLCVISLFAPVSLDEAFKVGGGSGHRRLVAGNAVS